MMKFKNVCICNSSLPYTFRACTSNITFIVRVPVSVLTDCKTIATPRNYVNSLFIDCLRNSVSNTKLCMRGVGALRGPLNCWFWSSKKGKREGENLPAMPLLQKMAPFKIPGPVTGLKTYTQRFKRHSWHCVVPEFTVTKPYREWS